MLNFHLLSGAYYYYKTETGKNYGDTIIDIYKNAKEMKIPYRLVLHIFKNYFGKKTL